MSTTLPTPATRQAAIIAAIAVLHAGAFIAASTGFRIPAVMPQLPTQEIFVMPAPARPAMGSRPEPVAPGDYQPEPVEAPKFVFTTDEGAGIDAVPAPSTSLVGGEGPPVAAAGDRGPAIRTRDARLQALVNRCYPASARRRGQEGRGVVRVVVEASGGAGAWGVETSTGSADLDAGMACVARLIDFEPALRGGHPVQATARVPIVFRQR